MSVTEYVSSEDGTRIAFERTGRGPALILVNGALSERSSTPALAAQLSGKFTVIAFDRRGRGESGDTQPYAVEREVEDIDALIEMAGGRAFVFGHSSGAVLALEAANQLGRINRLAVYEPPFIVSEEGTRLPPEYDQKIETLISEGKRGDAAEYFLTVAVGVPAGAVAQMKLAPSWPGMERIAHTLRYDQAVMGGTMAGRPLPRDRWTSVTIPTLVMDGGASPAWFAKGADNLAAVLSNSRRQTLPGQTHGADPEVIAPVLIEFFKG